MANLTKENLQISFDGHLWMKTNRQKTGMESNIRLLDVANHITDKVRGHRKEWKVSSCALLSKLQERDKGYREKVRYREERHVAHG